MKNLLMLLLSIPLIFSSCKKEVNEIGNTKIEKVKNANQLRFLNYILILIDILN